MSIFNAHAISFLNAKGLSHFVWTLDKLSVRRSELIATIEDVAREIVSSGAMGTTCYCVRLYERVDEWLASVGTNVSTHEDEW